MKEIFELQRKHVKEIKNSTVEERIEKLNKISNWIFANRLKINEALYADFKKPYAETDLSEIYPILSEIRHIKSNLKKWVKKKRVKKTLAFFSHTSYVKYEAKGLALIISPWNYPFLLCIGPLLSSISAGNCNILKPSEISENTSKLISDMISELFPKEEVYVFQGDQNVSSQLLELPFDHIFFTGSTKVGQIVAEAAIKNYTPFTLELGGKSPIVIDESAKIKDAAEKIVWAKFLNKGQTCIAPDYILAHKNVREELVEKLIDQIENVYKANSSKIEESTDYARIINDNHHKRLISIIEDDGLKNSKILYGGSYDKDLRFLEPTFILSDCQNCKISEEEIFGPILPIFEFDKIEEALEFINNKFIPLALYIFSRNQKTVELLIKSTQSGSVVINDLAVQFGHLNLPFGGIKHSGIGRAHGFAGFREFSNQRSYLKSSRINFFKYIYPPYSKTKKMLIDFMIKYL